MSESKTNKINLIIEENPEALLADGFDKAIIGMCHQAAQSPVVAYDYEKCINILKIVLLSTTLYFKLTVLTNIISHENISKT